MKLLGFSKFFIKYTKRGENAQKWTFLIGLKIRK